MIKYTDTQIVFREFIDEVTLAINLSLCPNNCVGCHSDYLRKDIGYELCESELDMLIKKNDDITCVGFMGGDNDTKTLLRLIQYVKNKYKLNVGWYSGKDVIDSTILLSKMCNYIKIGHYDETYGPLDKITTNQKMFQLYGDCYTDITNKYQKL